MSAGLRAPLAERMPLALELIKLLRPTCNRIELAGSMRREKQMVGDIDIVLRPTLTGRATGLFDEITTAPAPHAYLDLLDALLASGQLTKRLDEQGRPCWGQRHQRAVYQGVAVDLFCVLPPSQWGVIQFIRTGPADWSQAFVTPTSLGGRFLPPGHKVENGALWRLVGSEWVLVPTPEETDFFVAIGHPYVEPKHRRLESELPRVSRRLF